MGASMSADLALLPGCYVAASLLLLRHPRLLHAAPRPLPRPRTRLIAHRGGAAEGYENTLANFRRAVSECGAGMLELDVHLTRDKEVVVAHDQNLLRTAGRDADIRDLAYAELPRMRDTVTVDFCPGESFCDTTTVMEDRRLPRLEEVLTQFPDTQLNIDVKVPDEGLVEAVNKIIAAHGAEARCVWGSFSRATTERCHAANPDTGLMTSMARVATIYILFYLGLLAFVHIKESHLELPMPSIFLEDKFRSREANVKMAQLPPLLIRLADWLLMSPVLFSHLERRGVTVYLWVLNTEEQYERAFSLGAHGVMTDYPSKLRRFLDKKNA